MKPTITEKIEVVTELLFTLRSEARQKGTSDLDENAPYRTLKSGHRIQYVKNALIKIDLDGYHHGFFDCLCFRGTISPKQIKYNNELSDVVFLNTGIIDVDSEIMDYSKEELDLEYVSFIYNNLEEQEIEMLKIGRVARIGLSSLIKKR